jgi:hypothetical protein
MPVEDELPAKDLSRSDPCVLLSQVEVEAGLGKPISGIIRPEDEEFGSRNCWWINDAIDSYVMLRIYDVENARHPILEVIEETAETCEMLMDLPVNQEQPHPIDEETLSDFSLAELLTLQTEIFVESCGSWLPEVLS